MDDLTPLDRQVADEFLRDAGPSEPVDDAAIFTTITASRSPQWRFQSMFSATKFVVAGVIVALFGGFMLTGVLTQRSEERQLGVADSTAPVLLRGVDLVTVEVEPGVYRVVNDGVRDIVRPADDERFVGGGLDGNIVAGLDGSVWLFDRSGFLRLGEEGSHLWPKALGDDWSPRPSRGDIEVGPDGTLWLAYNDIPRSNRFSGGILSYDGRRWTSRRPGDERDLVLGVEVLPDESVWAAWQRFDRERVKVAKVAEGGWDELPGGQHQGRSSGAKGSGPLVSQEDPPSIWLIPETDGRLRRHDGDAWVVVETPEAGGEIRAAVGPDGTLWVRLHPRCGPGTRGDQPGRGCSGPSDTLGRFDGNEWDVYRGYELIPMMGKRGPGWDGFFAVAPDASLWFDPMTHPRPRIADYLHTSTGCHGIANFDGEAIRYFLDDTCIFAMDVAPDGSVWLQAGPGDATGPVLTYVITPDAVAGAE